MQNTDAIATLDECTVVVAPDTYAVVTTDESTPVGEAFATISDTRETTHVVVEHRLDDIQTQQSERGWRLLTFDIVLPFELVGFLATVASALAENDVSLFALSAYSTDHILVQDGDLGRTLDTLSDLGCQIRRE